jgi:hypothetical protein
VLELALVIGATLIVGVLAASMIRTHYVRAQIAVSVEEARAARDLVVVAFKDRGVPPRDAAAIGIDNPARQLLVGTYLEGLEVHNGRIDLRFGPAADDVIAGRILSLTPFETVDHQVVWLCGNEVPRVGVKPLGFAGGGPQAVQILTAIEDRYLPSECR